MTGRILVALRRSDRLEHVLPYLETIAQPDTKVVFLVHYAAGFERYLDARFSMTGGENKPKRQWRRLPEQEISLNHTCLFKLGAQIETALYAGGFRKAVSEYVRTEDVQAILVPSGRSGWLPRLWQKLCFVQQPFNLPTLPPVVLYFTRSL
jgi:hypothetical protein